MWADISQHTLVNIETEERKSGGEDATDDQETEYSGFFHPFSTQNICPSNKGQVDLNSSFHGSMSQASWSNKGWGADMESSFYKDDDSVKAEAWGYNKTGSNANRGSEFGVGARERAATTTSYGFNTLNQQQSSSKIKRQAAA